MATWSVSEPRQLDLDGTVGQLDVSLLAGRLNVVGTDGPARVEITRVGSRPVVVEHDGDRLVVRQERVPRWPGFLWWLTGLTRRMRCDVSIAVPAAVRARLRMVAGDAVVSGLRQDTSVEVTSGQVTLLGTGGSTSAEVTSGAVEALGLTGELTMRTTSGELTLADSRMDRVHARTVSGSITCDLDNAADSAIKLSTVSGSITTRIRPDSSLTVDLRTTSGRITSAFAELPPDDRPGSKQVRGVLGAGLGRLTAEATSGSIALLARPAVHDPAGPA